MRKIFIIASFVLMYGAAFGQLSQFRMIGSGSWSTVNDSTFSSTVTIQSDLTGNGFLPTGITDSMLIFSQTGQRYTISSAINLTFSSADLTIVESGGDWGAPVGQVIIYENRGLTTVPSIPFGSTGVTAKMMEAITTYNSNIQDAIAEGDKGEIIVSGGDWLLDNSVVDQANLTDNAVTTSKIASEAVTGDKIAENTIDNNNLTATGVVAGSYTNSDLTVNSAGRITSISNGTSGGGGTSLSVLDTTFTSNYTASTDSTINILTSITESNDILITLSTPSASTVGVSYTTNQIDRNNDGLGFTLVQVDGFDYDFYYSGDTIQSVAFTPDLDESFVFQTIYLDGKYRWLATKLSSSKAFELSSVESLYTSSYEVGERVTVLNSQEGYELNYHIESAIPAGLSLDSFSIAPTGSPGRFAVLKENRVLRPEMFGAKADFSRDTVTYTTGSNIIVCSGCSFFSSDVGKVVAIKRARIDTAYSLRRVAMNAYIESVVNDSTITIQDSLVDVTGRDAMIWGTNNWKPFQQMFNFADTYNVREVNLGQGDYYLSALGVTLESHSGNDALIQRGGISIKGAGKSKTKLKYGPEDVQRVDENDIVGYKAIYMLNDGHRLMEDFTIESPDRISTESAPLHTKGIFSEQRSGSDIELTMNRVDLVAGGDILDGFSHAVESSLGGLWDGVDSVINMVTFSFTECTIDAGSQVVTIFSQDGPTKEIIVKDCTFRGGGILNTETYTGVASIDSGNDTVTINVDTFSFYDIRSQYSTDRLPLVTLNGATNFTTSEVVNRNTAVFTTNSGSTLSNVDFRWYCQADNTEGHGMYLHPNVSVYIDELTHSSINGRAINYFTGSGQPGRTRRFYINKYYPTKPSGLISEMAIVGTNVNLGDFDDRGFTEIRNSDVSITYTGGNYAKAKIYDSYITGTVFGDTTYIQNCTGAPRFGGSGKTYEIYGGKYSTVDCEDLTGRYTVFDSEVAQLTLDGATDFIMNGGVLSQIDLPPTATNLTKGKISNTILKTGIGSTYFFNRATNDYSALRARLSFSNVKISGKAVANWSVDPPVGMMEIREGVNNTPISSRTTIIQPNAFTINTDYQDLRYLVVPYDFSYHSVSISNDSINELSISENGNTNIFKFYYNSNAAFQGGITINPTGSGFKFYPGGNLRLKHRDVRTEPASFRFDVDNLVWIETTEERKESADIPSREGINGEIVYHSDTESDTLFWKYETTITDVTSETHSLAAASLPFEFDLSNGKPYLAMEESSFIDPSTLMTITVPLTAGGDETFTVGNYGELTGSNGGAGNIRLSDGHVKINSLGSSTLNTSSSVSVDYKYISSEQWKANKTIKTQLVNAVNATDTLYPVDNIVYTVESAAASQTISIDPSNFPTGGEITIFTKGSNSVDFTLIGGAVWRFHDTGDTVTLTVTNGVHGFRFDGTNFYEIERL